SRTTRFRKASAITWTRVGTPATGSRCARTSRKGQGVTIAYRGKRTSSCLVRQDAVSGSGPISTLVACNLPPSLTIGEHDRADRDDQGGLMPEKKTIERARKDAREGKSSTTQAGEFVREEIHHVREGKHGARSTKQAIAIGLSKARRAGVKLRGPKRGGASKKTRQSAKSALGAGRKSSRGRRARPSARRSRATSRALKREGRAAASRPALARQARQAARKRR